MEMTTYSVLPIQVNTDTSLCDCERQVLIALFSFRGVDTNSVWPSRKSIADRTAITDYAKISKLTTSLAKKGWLTKYQRQHNSSCLYTLTIPDRLLTQKYLNERSEKMEMKDSPLVDRISKSNNYGDDIKDNNLSDDCRGGRNDQAGGGRNDHTEVTNEVTNEKTNIMFSSQDSKNPIPILNDNVIKISDKQNYKKVALEILEFLNERTGKNFMPVAAHIDLIVARLKEGSTLSQCRAVIAIKRRQWITDEKMVNYLRPKTLFNRTNFWQYVGELPRQKHG